MRSNWLREIQLWTLLGFALTLPFSKALANIFFVSSAVLWLMECILERRFLFPRSILNWLILAFVLSLFLSFMETSSLKHSIRGVEKILQRLGLFFLSAQILNTGERQKRFFKYLSYGVLVILFDGLIQLLTGSDFLRHRPIAFANQLPRITSCYEFADQYAIYLVFIIFLYAFLFFDKLTSIKTKIMYAVIVLSGTASLVITYSRAAWISLFAALIFSTLFMKRAVLVFSGILVILFLLVLASPSDVIIHKNAEGKEQSVGERFKLWGRAFQMINKHPITGVGINTYLLESLPYTEIKTLFNERRGVTYTRGILMGYYAHNSYLQIAAESGLITLSLFLAFLGTFFIMAYRRIQEIPRSEFNGLCLRATVCGAFGFVVMNLFESSFFSVQPSQLFYFILGTSVALIIEKEVRRSH